MKIQQSTFNLFFIFITCLFAYLIFRPFIPEKFYLDGRDIVDTIDMLRNQALVFYSDGYRNTGIFYSYFLSEQFLLGYKESTTFSLILLLVCWICALIISTFYIGNYKYLDFVIIFLWLMLFTVYSSFLNKELPFLVCLAVGFLASSLVKNHYMKIILILVPCLIFASYIRPYLFITCINFLVLYQFNKNKFNLKNSFLILILLLTFESLLYSFISDDFFSNHRLLVNISREGSIDAQTIIFNSIEVSSVFSECLNLIIMILRINFPLELLLLDLNPFYVLFVFLMSISSVIIVWKLYYLEKNPEIFNNNFYFQFSGLFILAFIITQATFEPDFGSYARHLTQIVPLFLIFFKTANEQ